MMKELHEMSQKMNVLNAKIKALKEEAGTYEKKEKAAYRERIAVRRANADADVETYKKIIDDCILQLNGIYEKIEYNKTALTLMKQQYQRAVRHLALTELYNHIDSHDGKKWTKRNIDKIEAVLQPLFDPLGIRCFISLNQYNFRNIDINFYYKNENERDNVTAWRVLDDTKYINANQEKRTTIEYDLQNDFYNQATDVLNAKNKIKKLKEQIQELEKTIPNCVLSIK